MKFPNLCHRAYQGTSFKHFSDFAKIWFTIVPKVPFRVWATPEPPKMRIVGEENDDQEQDSSYNKTLSLSNCTRQQLSNSTDSNTTTRSICMDDLEPKSAPAPYLNCSNMDLTNSSGALHSPGFPGSENGTAIGLHPPSSFCQWTITVAPLHNIYINFSFFHLEV